MRLAFISGFLIMDEVTKGIVTHPSLKCPPSPLPNPRTLWIRRREQETADISDYHSSLHGTLSLLVPLHPHPLIFLVRRQPALSSLESLLLSDLYVTHLLFRA